MLPAWSAYQEEAAAFFRTLGLEAQTNVTIRGARTTHDVDVLVKSRHAGFEVTWVVECKLWKTPISKLHVLGLREIISDSGADRGILLAENGFQSGAKEAAALTNVHLTSLHQVRNEASAEVFSMRLSDFYDRIEACRLRYWDIPKGVRVECGLRPEVSEGGYSGAGVISFVDDVLRKAFRGKYPLETDYMWRHAIPGIPMVIDSPKDLATLIDTLICELETKLSNCELAASPD